MDFCVFWCSLYQTVVYIEYIGNRLLKIECFWQRWKMDCGSAFWSIFTKNTSGIFSWLFSLYSRCCIYSRSARRSSRANGRMTWIAFNLYDIVRIFVSSHMPLGKVVSCTRIVPNIHAIYNLYLCIMFFSSRKIVSSFWMWAIIFSLYTKASGYFNTRMNAIPHRQGFGRSIYSHGNSSDYAAVLENSDGSVQTWKIV